MFSALMLIAVSMKANSTATVGTTDNVTYEVSLENSELAQPLATSFSNGRRVGRAAGRAIRGIVNGALLAAEAAYYYFAGDPQETVNNFNLIPATMSDFDN